MAYGFAIASNTPLTPSLFKEGGKRDVEWFKRQLIAAGIDPLYLYWHAQEHFSELESFELEQYVRLRKKNGHAQTLKLLRNLV